MGTVLVFLQQHNGKLLKSTCVAITAAQELKAKWTLGDLVGVALGEGAKEAAEEAATFGLSQVVYSAAPAFEKYLAAPYAAAVAQAVSELGSDVVVGASTSTGKDLLARVSAIIDAAQASDILAVNPDGSLRRPMYAGNVIADVELSGAKKVVTVRTTSFAAASPGGNKGSCKEITVNLDGIIAGEIVGYELSSSERPELGDAAVVVSGGRALQSEENFKKVIFPLADALGAAVGASRAAVDSGYAPNDWQVGQTGKVVAPNLYVAVGISGAIQHLAGMKDSKVIVAINKDPDAPIFEIADYGLVADLYEAAPALTEGIKKIKGA